VCDNRRTPGVGRQVADVAVEHAEERADGLLVRGDRMQVARVSTTRSCSIILHVIASPATTD
jgi:hypothetical protein